MVNAARSLIIALMLLLCVPPLHAEEDHEEAYRLRNQAAILPLETIVEGLGLEPDDRILEVEQGHEHGRYLYEIEYVTKDGHIREMKVDATTGRKLSEEQK